MSDRKKQAKKDLNGLINEFKNFLDSENYDESDSHLRININPTLFSYYKTKFKAAIYRYTTIDDPYRTETNKVLSLYKVKIDESDFILNLFGILKALFDDVKKDYLERLAELVHADSFLDILVMSNDLNNNGYVDAAAIIIGTGLELHLKNLCLKHNISILQSNHKNKKASQLSQDLYREKIITKGDNKDITSWLDVRNNPAHGNYNKYSKKKVDLVIQGISLFIKNNPA